MKTKILSFILMIAFVSCGQKQKSQQTENQNVAVDGVEKQDVDENVPFNDKDTSLIQIFDKDGSLKIKNVTYSNFTLYIKGDFKDYILKQTQTIEAPVRGDGQLSEIKGEIFDVETSKKVRTFKVNADIINIENDYIMSIKYGCCAERSYGQLFDIFQDNIFLKFSDNYNIIYIPNTNIDLYLGFLQVYDEKTLSFGEIYFVKKTRDTSFKLINKLIIRTENKDLFSQLPDFIDAKLLKNTEQDWLYNYSNYQKLTLWSYNKVEDLEKISFNVLQIEIPFEEIVTIELPIQNGYLFGNKSKEQIIYLDDYIKN